MNDPAPASPEKEAESAPRPGFKQRAKGLIEDFWKDPEVEFPPVEIKFLGRKVKVPDLLHPVPLPPGAEHKSADPAPSVAPAHATAAPAPSMHAAPAAPPVQRWHALPGELAEKMWGDECTLPAGDIVNDMLIVSLNLNKDKRILDLSAGLGGGLRKLAAKVGQAKGFERDAAIAARGMELSARMGKAKQAPIELFDPAAFSLPAMWDCVFARELFYRVADKGKLFYSIAACLKPDGQAAFTDYIVDPENRDKPAIFTWQTHEKDAKPLGLIEMAEMWAKVGFEVRASEDQSAFYRREIVNGVNRFVAALRAAPPADAETKTAILREVETWVHRLAAIQQGMKFYRFHVARS